MDTGRRLFNISYIDRNGDRVLFGPAQGRYMHPTREQAEDMLRALYMNAGETRLLEVCGQQAKGTFQVDEFECWDNDDPKSLFVEDFKKP